MRSYLLVLAVSLVSAGVYVEALNKPRMSKEQTKPKTSTTGPTFNNHKPVWNS
ncbi:BQ2448_3854 [Microbotryum intermedium]|uniref:BQ2448_3854 protein n=1 Tax=Microbotryum intermedium TaxID=269621 RepID=A0A238FGF2_9BASI|nr:BQ2448_3854 [Microbotryum intermedium]